MTKRIDFARQRRMQGRSLSHAVHELAALGQPLTGIDLQALQKETLAGRSEQQQVLAERLQQSVVPLFTLRSGHPDRIGSCVFVRCDSDFFAFTAAHVIRDANAAPLLAPSESGGGRLRPLPPCSAYLSPLGRSNELDIAVLAFGKRHPGAFQRHIFLSGTELDTDDRLDDHSFKSFYFVLGYPASRTPVNVDKAERRIHQQSFHCATGPVDGPEYIHEQISQADHILLDFDHKEIRLQGKRANPPRLQGVSGGGIFHISRETNHGPLVAIATQNRRSSRLIMGTRIKHFLGLVREIRLRGEGTALPD
jgi:hypothetical protein